MYRFDLVSGTIIFSDVETVIVPIAGLAVQIQFVAVMATVSNSSRFLSIEFIIYYVYIAAILILNVYPQTLLSSEACINAPNCQSKLYKGTIATFMENSDAQWRNFRGQLTMLVPMAIAHISCGYVSRHMWGLRGREMWLTISSIVTLVGVFGAASLWIVLLTIPTYLSAKYGGKHTPILVWVINIAMLFVIEWYSNAFKFGNLFGGVLYFLDSAPYQGIWRWHIGYNITILRMTSWGMDYYWAVKERDNLSNDNDDINQKIGESTVSKGGRSGFDDVYNTLERSAPFLSLFTFQNYMNYLFYTPLLIAGPIVTANVFLNQLTRSPREVHMTISLLSLLTRWLLALFLLEVILNYAYVYAIMSSGIYTSFPAMAIVPLMYVTINVLWLKFLSIWRFFRLWSLFDGVACVENMDRCVNNHYSLSGFWRSWHKSYNRWLTRYLYIPLGGNRVGLGRKVVNIFIVFTYVAIWHDMTFKLLTWGWLVGLCFVPELLGTVLLKKHMTTWYWRHIVSVGGALNIFAMMLANIVGYGTTSSGGVLVYVKTLLAGEGTIWLALSLLAFFCAVQIMVEVRVHENRLNTKQP